MMIKKISMIKYKTGKNSYEVIGKRNNGNREPDFKSIWKYDAIGNITEHCRFYNDTIEEKEIAIYNTKNQIIDYKSYGKNGKLDWQKSFKYDLNGNQIEALIFNSAGYYDHNKFNYNIKNKVIKSFSIDRNDKIEFKKTYEYNILIDNFIRKEFVYFTIIIFTQNNCIVYQIF